jgi:hypothetical protein
MSARRQRGAEERLALLAAGVAERRQAGRARALELAEGVDPGRLAALLRERRLLATLGPRLVEMCGEALEEGFAAEVEGSVAETRRQAALVALISDRVRGVLAGAGIRSASLKGPALGEELYGEPGRRPSSDIDLLLAADDLQRAVALVRELGYAAPRDPVCEQGLPLLHFALVHERGELPPVELHWRIHWYERDFASERLLPPSPDQRSWRPAPADELLSLLLYYARDGLLGLRHATDLGAWWDRHGEALEAAPLERVLRRYPALRPAALAATRAAEAVVGVPAAGLGGGGRLNLRGRAAVRLADPLPRASEAQVFADMGLVDGLLGPREGWRAFLLRQVAPPREALPQGPNGRPVSRLGNGARVLGRYALTVPRLLHPISPAGSGAEP